MGELIQSLLGIAFISIAFGVGVGYGKAWFEYCKNDEDELEDEE